MRLEKKISTDNTPTEKQVEWLFRNNYGKLFKLAFTMLGDTEDARDVVSEVFAKLLDRLRKEYGNGQKSPYNGQRVTGDARQDGSPGMPYGDNAAEWTGYLAVSVRNGCLNRMRGMSARQKAQRLFTMETDYSIVSEEKDTQRLDDIQHAIDTELSEQNRDIVRMRFGGELTLSDIARQQGISIAAVHKHITSSLIKIKSYLNVH